MLFQDRKMELVINLKYNSSVIKKNRLNFNVIYHFCINIKIQCITDVCEKRGIVLLMEAVPENAINDDFNIFYTMYKDLPVGAALVKYDMTKYRRTGLCADIFRQ